MPKRTAAESFAFYMPLLLQLISDSEQETAKKYFEEWEAEIRQQAPRKKSKKVEEDFKTKLEQYLTFDNVQVFNVNEEDFVSIESSFGVITKLIESDKLPNSTLLKSAAFQGRGFKKILELCERRKKIFVEKLKEFEIPYNVSYCYFLMKLSDLILPHVLFLNSAMPISFVRQNFKKLEQYIKDLNKPALMEEMSFGSQSQ